MCKAALAIGSEMILRKRWIDPGEAHLPDRGIRSAFKTPTTTNVTEGITKAIEGAISKCGIPLEAVAAVMIGTTVSLSLGPISSIRGF